MSGTMRFQIVHTTGYAFSRPVFLEPHTIRLHPRHDGSVLTRAFEMHITPPPSGFTDRLDAEGNVVRVAWFDGLTESLQVVTRLTADALRTNPFDFYVPDAAGRVPFDYPPTPAAMLAPYLTRVDGAADDDRVAQLADVLLAESAHRTLPFLMTLTHRLNQRMAIVIRREGAPHPPLRTLDSCQGACRDVTELFCDACRAVGIAARFVSGYQAGDPDQDQRDLHAWPEAYIPGAGWRGFDPTLGLAVADEHLPLAATRHPADAMPVTGSVRGNEATSQMESHIELTAMRDPMPDAADQSFAQ